MRFAHPLFLVLGLLYFSQAVPQNLKLPISNYTNRVYGRTFDATNHCILASRQNLIYAGNANGILEYDGNAWRFIPVRQGAYVTSLAVDESGRIYVGSQNEFGYLEPGIIGDLVYRSLSDSLDEFDRFFSVVWATHAGRDRVFFQSEETLFIYQDGGVTPINPETSFHTSFLVNEKLYIRERSKGLMVLEGDILQKVKGGSEFSDLGIFAMLALEDGKGILMATREKGFFTWSPVQGVRKLHTRHDPFLIASGITGGIPLSDGCFALNTLHEGIIVINQSGLIQRIFNKNSGLRVDDVKSIFQDSYDNIWCAMDNGIGKIDYDSPVSFYHENAGLEGGVYAVAQHRGRLYVGTTSGLFRENRWGEVNLSLDFSPVNPVRDQVWDLLALDNELLIATSNGLYRAVDEKIVQISEENSFTLYYLEKNALLLVGGSGGLSAYRKKGTWTKVMDFPDVIEDVKSVAVNHSSLYDETEIWVGTSYQGTLKILLKKNLDYEIFRYFGQADGLPGDWVLPMNHGDSVVFGTRIGLLQFVDEMIIRKFLPDSLKDDPDYNRGYFEGRLLTGHQIITPVSFISPDGKDTWAVIDNEITLIRHEEPGVLVQKPFKIIDLGKVNMICPQDGGIIWIGAAEGLARYDMNKGTEPDSLVFPLIRKVLLKGDSLIFNGAGKATNPTIDYRLNHLQFSFTSPYYEDETKNRYSWRLLGAMNEWTEWTNRRITSYTNLREGSYEFQVRSKNIYGDVSPVATYGFTVRPPWARTPFAYVIYVILSIAMVYLAVRLGQIRLRRKNERLETIVQQRTAEIRKQNLELARQKQEITDSIYYAERIQRAILPQTDRIAGMISGHFILFKPKDIVSGDFYWLAENGRKIIVGAVDCTGHGVPGAFMSMLGVSFLNKIILENNTMKADRILNELRENVIAALKQTGREGEARDGMDIALVVIDMDGMHMEFAGANNPMYMIRGDELNETKADRMPIAYHIRTDDFSSHSIPLRKGDSYYLFSDGYADQFGGPNGKKFKYRAFKELLLQNKGKPMEEQKAILDDTIEKWKTGPGPDGKPYEQVDDILVIGIRI